MKGQSSMQLWIASGNPAKVKELNDLSIQFFPEVSATIAREPKDVVENEPTFQGNASLKAHALAQELINEGHKDFTVLGDDSGLCVDALGGRPGVYSGRYAGAGSNSLENVDKVLSELNAITSDLEKRAGQYRCALCFIQVFDGKMVRKNIAEGFRDGLIAPIPKGTNGYAYDAVFLDVHTHLSYGEVSYLEKQKDSHRRRAFESLQSILERSVS